eukprot:6189357-Pleurochrysis_carterae.AAC.1
MLSHPTASDEEIVRVSNLGFCHQVFRNAVNASEACGCPAWRTACGVDTHRLLLACACAHVRTRTRAQPRTRASQSS